ncbi:DUF7380 domain-containing protein [Luteibacter yeojuensis]
MPPSRAPWTVATVGDADAFDFSFPPATLTEASAHAIGHVFALELAALEGNERTGARARVLTTLASALEMHARLERPREPYGPQMEWDNKRTAIPTDWADDAVEVLVTLGTRATNPVIKARLFDIAWLVERRRVQTGHDAAAACLDVATGLREGTLRDSTDGELPGSAIHTLENVLRRGLQIARQLRQGEPEGPALSEFVVAAAAGFEATGEHRALKAMLRLIYDFDLADDAVMGDRLERLAADSGPDEVPHGAVETMTMAAMAWRKAGDLDGYERCLMAASRIFADRAEVDGGHFASSHWVQQALDLLRGLRSASAKTAKKALRIRLIELQANVNEEMGIFEHPIDLTPLIEATTARMEGVTLLDGLFVLADISRPRSPATLADEARAAVAQFPLSSMFAVQQHDIHGYVRFRAPGAMPGIGAPEALEHQTARAEALTRELTVNGQINVVIASLAARFAIAERDLFPLLRQSLFVPPDLVRTYARGFASFLHGDMIAAMAILIPLLEASLLHVLKAADIDVVSHNENDQTQEAMSIQQLFDKLRGDLDNIFGEAMTADIHRVFLARSGPALRHAVAHGDVLDQTPFSSDTRYACWLIFRLALIPLFDQYEQHRREAQGGLARVAVAD